MPTPDRLISVRGPRFYREGGELMFVLHLDGSTRDGPRPATKADKAAHAEALGVFERGEAPALGPRVTFDDPAASPARKAGASAP